MKERRWCRSLRFDGCRPPLAGAWTCRSQPAQDRGHDDERHDLRGGFGGLERASLLSERLADDVDVTLVDQDDAFVFGFSNMEVLFGRQTADEVRIQYRAIRNPV